MPCRAKNCHSGWRRKSTLAISESASLVGRTVGALPGPVWNSSQPKIHGPQPIHSGSRVCTFFPNMGTRSSRRRLKQCRTDGSNHGRSNRTIRRRCADQKMVRTGYCRRDQVNCHRRPFARLEHRIVDVNRLGFTNQFEHDSRVVEDFDHAASFVQT